MFKTGDFPVRYVTVYQAGYLMSTERACSIPRRATVHCWSVREVWRHMPVGDACRSHGIWFFFWGKMSPMIRCFFEILVLMELGSSVIFYGYSMDILWIFYPQPPLVGGFNPSEKYASSSVGMIFHSQLNGKSESIPWFQSPPTSPKNRNNILRKRILSRFSMEYLFAFLPRDAKELTRVLVPWLVNPWWLMAKSGVQQT